VVLVKEVAEAMLGVWPEGRFSVSFLGRPIGETPLMESIDADGERSAPEEALFRDYKAVR
jgi:hypothetical protein